MENYTVSISGHHITVKARAHRQHIHNKSVLVGLTKTGYQRLEKFLAKYGEWSPLGFYANSFVDVRGGAMLAGFEK